jgi:hypothetical protein
VDIGWRGVKWWSLFHSRPRGRELSKGTVIICTGREKRVGINWHEEYGVGEKEWGGG